MDQPTQLTESLYYLPKGAGLVSFGRGDTTPTPNVTNKGGNEGKDMRIATRANQTVEIRSWGQNNLLPQEREALVLDNNIVPELIATKRDITVGGGLMAYRERWVDGARVIEEVEPPAEATAFFDRLPDLNGGQTIHEYLMKSARSLMFHANTFTEMIRETVGDKVATFRAIEARYMRPEKHDDFGRIRNWFWSGNWKDFRKKEYLPIAIPNYDRARAQKKFIVHKMDDLLSDDYLGIPSWWGGRAWIEVANAIPIFHINNLRNGYTIRYHIEIPKDYFWDYTAPQQTEKQKTDAKEKETAAREAFLARMDSFLAGAEQAGRAMYSTYELNKAAGTAFPGIKITPVNVDLKDKALLELFERSNEANISGQGVHPTLAAIQTQGKLSSGSEIRNAFLMYVAIKTQVKRSILLDPINLVHRINGWDPTVKWGFRDIEITSLDENPAGAQEVAVM